MGFALLAQHSFAMKVCTMQHSNKASNDDSIRTILLELSKFPSTCSSCRAWTGQNHKSWRGLPWQPGCFLQLSLCGQGLLLPGEGNWFNNKLQLIEALSLLMIGTPVFIFTSGSSALLGRPRCGLSIWLSLLAIFSTLFWVDTNFFHEKTDKTKK